MGGSIKGEKQSCSLGKEVVTEVVMVEDDEVEGERMKRGKDENVGAKKS